MWPVTYTEGMSSTPLSAQVCMSVADLGAEIEFFVGRLGFKLEMIFPADDPRVAVLGGHGLSLRIERGGAGDSSVRLRLLGDTRMEALTSPGGVRVEFSEKEPPLKIPPTRHELVIQSFTSESPWVTGRAGMRYRDLIPGRLGGKVIASQIHVPDAGPVPDTVHYHELEFQLIVCIRGWVRLVYEDQGEPFVLSAGDCLIQPPKIRHHVLESSGDMHVVELATPAEHVTRLDPEFKLPTAFARPEKIFGAQRFCLSRARDATWTRGLIPGLEYRETGVSAATQGLASVQFARVVGPGPQGALRAHDLDFEFYFVIQGSVTLEAQEHGKKTLSAGDAVTIPPGMGTAFLGASRDLEMLWVGMSESAQ